MVIIVSSSIDLRAQKTVDYRASIDESFYKILQKIQTDPTYFKSSNTDNSQLKFNSESTIEELERRLNDLIYQTQLRDAIVYNDLAKKVYTMFNDGDQIGIEYENLKESNNIIKTAVSLTSIGNPTNDELGFKFIDKVLEIAEETLIQENDSEEEKKEKRGFLKNLIQNNFVQNLLNSTPLGGITNSIVASIKSRSQTVLTNKVNQKLKDLKISDFSFQTKGQFDTTLTTLFEDKLQIYISLYSSLANATESYENEISILELEMVQHSTAAKTFYDRFYSNLGIDPNGLSRGNDLNLAIGRIIPPGLPDDDPAYAAQYISNPNVHKAADLWEEYNYLKSFNEELKSRHVVILYHYFIDVRIALLKFADLEQSKQVNDKINSFLEEINGSLKLDKGNRDISYKPKNELRERIYPSKTGN